MIVDVIPRDDEKRRHVAASSIGIKKIRYDERYGIILKVALAAAMLVIWRRRRGDVFPAAQTIRTRRDPVIGLTHSRDYSEIVIRMARRINRRCVTVTRLNGLIPRVEW